MIAFIDDNEALIVGNFKSQNSDAELLIISNHEWMMIDKGSVITGGNWEFSMSEDGCYWNIESEDVKYRVQTWAPDSVKFKDQGLSFNK